MTDPLSMFDARSVPFAFHGARLTFDLATTVFSSSGIDAGSALLLRRIQEVGAPEGGRVLDLGSGHGVLGVVLAALDEKRSVTFVDRDALACHYTARNLVANGLDPTRHRVVGGIDYGDEVVDGGPYDLIVSNLPGKAGDGPISDLVEGAAAQLCAGGLVGFVVVTPLADLVAAAMERAGLSTELAKGNKAHTVFIARGSGVDAVVREQWSSAFARGVYDRGGGTFSAARSSWTASTVTGIDEFDSLGYATRQLARVMRTLPAQRAVVVNPGQGHRALLVSIAGHDLRALVSRDALALRASSRLLAENGRSVPTPVHAVTVDDEILADIRLLVIHADDKVHVPWLRAEVERHLDRKGRRSLAMTGRASLLGRLEAELLRRRPGRVVEVRSERGHRALVYSQER